MKSSAVVLALVCGLASCASAASAGPRPQGGNEASSSSSIPIVRRSEDGPRPDGSYTWSYETGNGIKAEEQGELKPAARADEEGVASVRGSYSYPADDGSPVELRYTADENGFRPQGSHIPQPPEIPEGILRALEWIASHPEEDNL